MTYSLNTLNASAAAKSSPRTGAARFGHEIALVVGLLALVFWCLHQPRHVGVLVACGFGLIMDVHRTSLLGTHMLAYGAAAYVVYLLHRRLPLFRAHWQALQLSGVFVATHGLLWLLHLASGGHWPGAGLLFAPVLEALLWPLLDRVLLAPQRRAPNPDANRPL